MSSFLALFHDHQISEVLGSYLTTDEAVRVVLSTSLLYRAQDMNSPTCFHTRVFLKSSLLFGGCPPHLRSRLVAHTAPCCCFFFFRRALFGVEIVCLLH